MLNFAKLFNQLDQEALPLLCNEGVFRFALDIYFQKKDEFRNIIPMLGGFHREVYSRILHRGKPQIDTGIWG